LDILSNICLGEFSEV